MKYNAAGNMVNKIWSLLPERYPNISVEIYQIMPNHFHGIIIINEININVGATLVASVPTISGWI
jgi:REP element-mobilizing transposase RayT